MYDSETGRLQPTARIMWKASPASACGATSHALRTGSRYSGASSRSCRRSNRCRAGPCSRPRSAPGFQAETLRDVEAGYRLEIGSTASVDVTAYFGHYDLLPKLGVLDSRHPVRPTPAILVTSQFDNQLEADTRGVEVSGHWRPSSLASERELLGLSRHARALASPSGSDPSGRTPHDGSVRRPQMASALVVAGRFLTPRSTSRFFGRTARADQRRAYTRTDVTAERPVRHPSVPDGDRTERLRQAHTEFYGAKSSCSHPGRRAPAFAYVGRSRGR